MVTPEWLYWSGYLLLSGYLSEGDHNIVQCPSSERLPNNGTPTPGDRDVENVKKFSVSRNSYTSNYKGLYKDTYSKNIAPTFNGSNECRYIDIKAVTLPTETFLLTEAFKKSSRQLERWYWHSSVEFFRIHGTNRYNTLFFDGHVEAIGEGFVREKIHSEALFRY